MKWINATIKISLAAISFVVIAPLDARAATFDLDIIATADNSYGIYLGADDQSATTFIGGDNNTSAGDILDAEQYSIQVEDTDYIYIAAWSDHGVAQFMMADIFNQTTGDLLTSGDLSWEVTATGIPLNVNSSAPTLSQLNEQIDLANSQNNPSNGWQEITIGSLSDYPNILHPQSAYVSKGFSTDSKLMWYNSLNSSDPFSPGQNHDEYLIFRLSADATAVPEPGTLLGLMGLTALGACLRDRKTHQD